MARAKLQPIPFTNMFGQTLQPGDRCIAITSGYSSRVHIGASTYVGMTNGSPSIQTPFMARRFVDATGKRIRYTQSTQHEGKWVEQLCKGQSTLKLGRVFKL